MADWIVAPETGGRRLADVLPSLLAAMGTAGFDDALGIPRCRNAVALLIDGLGWELLHRYAEDAPFLTSLATEPPLTAGFPTTTVTSITSLGTGRGSGSHGMVGYTFAEPGGGLLHPLTWRRHGTPEGEPDSLLESWPPESVQPGATVPERAGAAGVQLRTAVPREFEGTGLTRAALRGGRFRGVAALGDLVAELIDAAGETAPCLVYGYHGHLDMMGHVHGPGSLPWRMQLRQIDRLVRSVAENLPASVTLAVVADHGMVTVDPERVWDADTDPALLDGVRLLGGEARARHIHTEPGAEVDVRAAWRETLGADGVVLGGEEAIAAGWFGPVVTDEVRARIGDLLAVTREHAVVRSVAEPKESALIGQHGSLTAAEQYVPLLLAQG